MGTTAIMRTCPSPRQPQYVSVDEVICYADRCHGYNLERALRKSASRRMTQRGGVAAPRAAQGCLLFPQREARRWRPCLAEVLLGPPRPRLHTLPDRPTQVWAPRTEPSRPPGSATPVAPARPAGASRTPATLLPPGPLQPEWATTKSSGPSAREISRL